MERKIAIDIHGVLDLNPTYFVNLALDTLKDEDAEVHIMTGIEWSSELEKELMSLAFQGTGGYYKYWTHFHSIITHLKNEKEPGYYDEKGRYWFYEDSAWDRVKGILCHEHQITEIYDDTIQYRGYMPSFTNFFLYSHDPQKHEMKLRNPHLSPKPEPASQEIQKGFLEKDLNRA